MGNDARSRVLALDREPPRNIEVSFWNRLVTMIPKLERFFAFWTPWDARKMRGVIPVQYELNR